VTGWPSQVAKAPELTPTPDAPEYQPPTVLPLGPAGAGVRDVLGGVAPGERDPDGEPDGDHVLAVHAVARRGGEGEHGDA